MKLDAIVVPDFEGPARQAFEHTTNLFLASWLEHGSQLSNCQLHLVCIGEPADPTVRLADQAQSRVTICAPISGPDRFRNKLRGFEVTPSGDYFMLLDTDIVLFHSIDKVIHLLDADSLALGYANGAHLSLSQWDRLYDRLGMTPPTSRVSMVNASFGNAFDDHPLYDELSATVPYFNAGVVAAPWIFGLDVIWKQLIDQVPDVLQGDEQMDQPIVPHALYDQPPLAIAAEVLKRRGKRVSVLPDVLHARWQHFCQGLVSVDDVLIAHNTGMFKPAASADIRTGIHAYSVRSRNRMDNRNPSLSQIRRLIEYADRFEEYLSKLCADWIESG